MPNRSPNPSTKKGKKNHDRKPLKQDTPFMRSIVKKFLADGTYTQAEMGEKIGVSAMTVNRWVNEKDTNGKEADIQNIRSELNHLDHQALAKLTLIQDFINDEFIHKAMQGELSKLEVEKLSKVALDVAKVAGIRWDKVMFREHGLTYHTARASPEQLILLMLSKAASILAEKEAYEAMKEDGVINI